MRHKAQVGIQFDAKPKHDHLRPLISEQQFKLKLRRLSPSSEIQMLGISKRCTDDRIDGSSKKARSIGNQARCINRILDLMGDSASDNTGMNLDGMWITRC